MKSTDLLSQCAAVQSERGKQHDANQAVERSFQAGVCLMKPESKIQKIDCLSKLTPLCPYCREYSEKVSGKLIYPHRKDLWVLTFYTCAPCDAYVGTHKGTDKPLGRLADKQLRIAKSQAHAAFDPIWRNGYMSRKDAYKWLSKELGIDGKDCHIGMFDMDMCNAVVRACANLNGS